MSDRPSWFLLMGEAFSCIIKAEKEKAAGISQLDGERARASKKVNIRFPRKSSRKPFFCSKNRKKISKMGRSAHDKELPRIL